MSFVSTLSGREIDLWNPRPEDICIEDIAVGLARCARFAGQTLGEWSYSVAQHSDLVSRIVAPPFALMGLLHDAPEAYLNDLTSPVKCEVTGYDELEEVWLTAIFRRFGLPTPMPACIKQADNVALATERRDLVPPGRREWPTLVGVVPLAERIVPLDERAARGYFMDRFHSLTPWAGRPCVNG